MKIVEYLSTEPDLENALEEVLGKASQPGGPGGFDLGLVFQAGHPKDGLAWVGAGLREKLGVRHLLGCTAESTIGGRREVEGRPSLALWLARLPGVEIETFHCDALQTADWDFSYAGLPDLSRPREHPILILVADPFSTPVDHLLEQINEEEHPLPVVGGLASGGLRPRQNQLLCQDATWSEGAVGVLLSGALTIHTVVSQGCRPFGTRFIATEVDGNALIRLGGRPAFECMQSAFSDLDLGERELFQTGPMVGQAMTEMKDSFGRGDFLVRNIVGADPGSGALFINDTPRRGRTVQFHVRDARSASEDIEELLTRERERLEGTRIEGGLLFSCNGRGSRLFTRANHDIDVIRSRMGKDLPVAGFFAGGEFGPVGGKNFLHGFTASVALFGPAE